MQAKGTKANENMPALGNLSTSGKTFLRDPPDFREVLHCSRDRLSVPVDNRQVQVDR